MWGPQPPSVTAMGGLRAALPFSREAVRPDGGSPDHWPTSREGPPLDLGRRMAWDSPPRSSAAATCPSRDAPLLRFRGRSGSNRSRAPIRLDLLPDLGV